MAKTTTSTNGKATTAKKKTAPKMPASIKRNSAVARLERNGGAIEKRRVDGWTNIVTGMGTARDKRTATEFSLTDVSLFQQEFLDAIYSCDGITARIVDIVPDEMMREGYEIVNDPNGDLADLADDLNVDDSVTTALQQSRLYGTSFILMGADDGQKFDRPLNIEKVKSLNWLSVLSRFDLTIAKRYSDPGKAKHDEPELYELRVIRDTLSDQSTDKNKLAYGSRIHESRLIRFDGVKTPKQVMRENSGWSLSVMQRFYEPIKEFNEAISGISALIPDFSQAIIKIKGLADMLSADQDNLVLNRLAMLDYTRSALRMMPLDAEHEDFERKSTPMTGISDAFDRVANRLSAVTGIPMTLLMGISPGGMNATGDSDHRFLYNQIRALQKKIIKKPVTQLLNLIAFANKLKPVDKNGTSLEDNKARFTIAFRPLWTPTDKEIAETRKSVADTDKIYLEAGVLDAAEVAVSRFENGYSMETTIDRAILGNTEENDKPIEGEDAQTSKRHEIPADADVDKIVGVITQAASGALPVVAARNVLIELYGVGPDKADRLLADLEKHIAKKEAQEEKAFASKGNGFGAKP